MHLAKYRGAPLANKYPILITALEAVHQGEEQLLLVYDTRLKRQAGSGARGDGRQPGDDRIKQTIAKYRDRLQAIISQELRQQQQRLHQPYRQLLEIYNRLQNMRQTIFAKAAVAKKQGFANDEIIKMQRNWLGQCRRMAAVVDSWQQPSQVQEYFAPAIAAVRHSLACVRTICDIAPVALAPKRSLSLETTLNSRQYLLLTALQQLQRICDKLKPHDQKVKR